MRLRLPGMGCRHASAEVAKILLDQRQAGRARILHPVQRRNSAMEVPLHAQEAEVTLARREDVLVQQVLVEAIVGRSGVRFQGGAEGNGVIGLCWQCGCRHRRAP